MSSWLFQTAALLPGIIMGLTFHEYAHARVADILGDKTARSQGRLTINPLPHLDPLGTILLFVAGFGWAKPVPVNPYNLKGDKKFGMLLISLAGPATNVMLVILGFVLGTIFFGRDFLFIPLNSVYLLMIKQGIWINAVLAALNILPVPPLDGSKILAGILPNKLGGYIYQFETYGSLILLGLMLFGLISAIIMPIAFFIIEVVDYIFRYLF